MKMLRVLQNPDKTKLLRQTMSNKGKDWEVTNRKTDIDIPIMTLFGARVRTSTYTVENKRTGEERHVTVSFNENRSRELDRLGEKISHGKFDKE
jgi:hypothetical protein